MYTTTRKQSTAHTEGDVNFKYHHTTLLEKICFLSFEKNTLQCGNYNYTMVTAMLSSTTSHCMA